MTQVAGSNKSLHQLWWIQQVTTRVCAVPCWIQLSVSPKQVVGLICVFNSEVDQLIVVPYTWSLKYLVPLVDLKSKSMSKTIQNVQKPATNVKKMQNE